MKDDDLPLSYNSGQPLTIFFLLKHFPIFPFLQQMIPELSM